MPSTVLFFVWLALLCNSLHAQIAWTPIYVDEKSQIDLWTQQARGCSCPWDSNGNQCACCVEGGCLCGKETPNRCTQCGLEQHCNQMCNITIDATELLTKSGKTFGLIKSPSLEGPKFCSYTFIPEANQRVEIQIYRILNIGKPNGTRCVNGYLQLIRGTESTDNFNDYLLCGVNERYSPPVVFFIDEGPATLLLDISEKTSRSQFLAYFSFPLINTLDGLGFPARGGMRLQNTDCDWLFQDFECEEAQYCVLASPGYPGVYPPFRKCKYHITSKSENIQIRVTFTSILLPQNSCKTDYISVYKGRFVNSPLLETFCGDKRKVIEYSGPNLLIEFSSGPQNPPYDYNGFVAHLEFFERKTTTAPSVSKTTNSNEHMETTSKLDSAISSNNFSGCDIQLNGTNIRSGHFDTREHDMCQISRLTFKGRPTDVIYVSIFNYRLRSPMCKTVVEIFDGSMDVKKNLIGKMCSPQDRYQNNLNFDTKKILSTGNELVIYFQRPTIPRATNEIEFIAGRYFFHDEQISGTIKPKGVCSVAYKGNTSPSVGMIENPTTQSMYFDSEGPVECTQEFIPSFNQSITIKIQVLEEMSNTEKCITQCGDNGCFCTSHGSMEKIDHLLLINENGKRVTCLCGENQREMLPIVIQSWSAITLIYSVARYTWKKKGFEFSATYSFDTDYICGEEVYTLHTGEIISKNLSAADNLNYFYVQACTWTLHSNVERQLELEIYSHQNRPCTAWDISIHEYSVTSENRLGDVLYTFCSRDAHKAYLLPWKLNTVIIRLSTLSRTLPQFRIKWKSHVVRANTRFGGPTPAPDAVSCSECSAYIYLAYFIPLLLKQIIFEYNVFDASLLCKKIFYNDT